MSVNLVDLIGRELSGAVGQKIAGAIGGTPQATAAGVSAAVPAVLGGLIGKVSSASGAADLLSLLTSGNHDSTLSNLGTALAGGDATKSLIDKGSSLLSGISAAAPARSAAMSPTPRIERRLQCLAPGCCRPRGAGLITVSPARCWRPQCRRPARVW